MIETGAAAMDEVTTSRRAEGTHRPVGGANMNELVQLVLSRHFDALKNYAQDYCGEVSWG